MTRFIERPLTSESPIQCALGSEMGDGGGARAALLVRPPPPYTHFRVRRLPNASHGMSGLYKRPTNLPGGVGTQGLGDTLGYPPPGYPPEVPWGIPWGDRSFPNGGPFGEAQTKST